MQGGGFWLWFHLAFVFAGLTMFVMAVLSAGTYLFQSHQLKSHRPGRFFLKLPSLDVLDRVHTAAVAAGIVLFSIGLLSGLFWAETKSKMAALGKDPTVVLSVIGCLLYWGILAMRLKSIGRGRKIALGTLGVFAILCLAVLNAHSS